MRQLSASRPAGPDGVSQRARAPRGPPGARPSTIRRIASADSSGFGTNPAAGLSAIRSAKSASAWVEIKITAGLSPRRDLASRRAKVEPALTPQRDVDQDDLRAQL